MYKPPYSITSKMVHLISQISEEMTKIEINESSIISPKLRKISRIKTIAGTLEIEGNFMGEERVTAMMEGKRVLGTYKEILEVEGAINTYKEFENYKYSDLKELLKAHKLLMKDILTTAGKFRGVNVGVGSKDRVTHIAPQPHLIPKLMEELFEWLKHSDEHPLIQSCVFHYEFEFIHPFSDGNGRIGRLWQSVILHRWKKTFIAIPTESMVRDYQENYYKALEGSGSLGESTPFIEFMLDIILKSIKNSVKNSVKSSVNTEDKILTLLKQDPTLTIRIVSEKLDLTQRAVEKQIAKLKSENRLQRVGSARKGKWVVVDES